MLTFDLSWWRLLYIEFFKLGVLIYMDVYFKTLNTSSARVIPGKRVSGSVLCRVSAVPTLRTRGTAGLAAPPTPAQFEECSVHTFFGRLSS